MKEIISQHEIDYLELAFYVFLVIGCIYNLVMRKKREFQELLIFKLKRRIIVIKVIKTLRNWRGLLSLFSLFLFLFYHQYYTLSFLYLLAIITINLKVSPRARLERVRKRR
jgi:hypothetical protein